MLKVWIERDIGTNQYGIYLAQKISQGGQLFVAKPVKLEMLEISDYEPFKGIKIEPFLKLDGIIAYNLLAQLAKALSDIGFKVASDKSEMEKVLDAVKYHLEDMRQLVFKKRG